MSRPTRPRPTRPRPTLPQTELLRAEVERLRRANIALTIDRDTAVGELKLCREELRRERQARLGTRPLDDGRPEAGAVHVTSCPTRNPQP